MSNFFSKKELLGLGFSKVGEGNLISKKSNFYDIRGEIGSGNRIDDFCIIKGNIFIGNKVHICSHTSLSGVGGNIVIGDLSGIGVNNIFYTASDDMFQSSLCGPLVDKKLTSLKTGDINIGTGVALGGRVTIMPNVKIGNFSAVGLQSIITKDLEPYYVYMIVRGKLKKIIKRDKGQLDRFYKLEQ